MATTLIVRKGLLDPPLLITDDALAVEVYDGNNDLIAVMHKVINNDLWGVTTKGDPDWVQTLCQLGYVTGGSVGKLGKK